MNTSPAVPARPAWRTAPALGRVSNLPTVWTNVAAGVVLAGGNLEPVALAALLLALSLFYVGGMYLNDAFDRHWDARERPQRPIPAGRVRAFTVFLAGFGMLALGEALLIGLGLSQESVLEWRPALWGLALAAAIVYYDCHHKTNPFSPVVMGVCRGLVYLIAGTAAAPDLPTELLLGAALLLAYLVGLTYAAKQEQLARVKNLWPVGFLALPFAYLAPLALKSPVTAGLYAAFLVWVGFALYQLMKRPKPNFPLAVSTLIAGISLLDAALIAGQGQHGVALLAAGGAALTRLLQRYVPGT